MTGPRKGRRRRQLTRDIVKRQPALASSPSPPRPASLAWTRRPPSRKQNITGSLWPGTWLSICMPFDGWIWIRLEGDSDEEEWKARSRRESSTISRKVCTRTTPSSLGSLCSRHCTVYTWHLHSKAHENNPQRLTHTAVHGVKTAISGCRATRCPRGRASEKRTMPWTTFKPRLIPLPKTHTACSERMHSRL